MTACTTTATAVAHHGIDDGMALIAGAFRDIAAAGRRSPVVSAEYTERIATAFRRAFIRTAPVPLVPEPVDAAIDDATEAIVHAILDDPGADLRAEILPAFYRVAAGTYRARLEAGGDPGTVGAWDASGRGGR